MEVLVCLLFFLLHFNNPIFAINFNFLRSDANYLVSKKSASKQAYYSITGMQKFQKIR